MFFYIPFTDSVQTSQMFSRSEDGSYNSTNTTSGTTTINCLDYKQIEQIIMPYVFPMLIEHCVVSSTFGNDYLGKLW